ncbi:pilus assembly protein PilM [Candidatus Nomurabacteria bacterium]|nr:pilus assembly protein PilM [Candidatus Nomurabacteria bacterium]
MLNILSNRFFPMPRFLMSPSFGLDISDESLKFAELIPAKDGIRIGKYGERKIPTGIIESGKIKDPIRLEQILLSLRKEEGIRFVRVSLPEEQVYLFKFKLGKEGLVNIREAIELSFEDHVPIKAEDAVFDYQIISEDDENLELEIGAIPKDIVENYMMVFRSALMSVQSLELEAQAISRAVVKKGDLETYMIVDFGQTRTGIFIISRGVAVFTSTLEFGGMVLTQMIQKNFGITFEEAEKMKRDFGLERNSENREIFSVLLNTVSVLRDEINRHFLYWHTHKDEEGRDRPRIKKIILCGGDSNLVGLPEYLSVSIKNKVEMADIWTNINNTEEKIPEITFDRALTYAAALGLALGDFEYD